MAIDWDALYELAPSDATYVKDTDDAIRSLKTATRERVTKEHEFDLASQARQGLHRAGSAVAFYQASDPTQRNGVALAAEDAGILFIDSDDKNIKAWDGDSFENVKPAVAVLADSATNADTVDSQHVTTTGNGIRAVHGSFSATDPTSGTLFSAIAGAVPTTGDVTCISGVKIGGLSGSTFILDMYVYATRTSPTVVTLSGAVLILTGTSTYTKSLDTATLTSGSATTFPGAWALAW